MTTLRYYTDLSAAHEILTVGFKNGGSTERGPEFHTVELGTMVSSLIDSPQETSDRIILEFSWEGDVKEVASISDTEILDTDRLYIVGGLRRLIYRTEEFPLKLSGMHVFSIKDFQLRNLKNQKVIERSFRKMIGTAVHVYPFEQKVNQGSLAQLLASSDHTKYKF